MFRQGRHGVREGLDKVVIGTFVLVVLVAGSSLDSKLKPCACSANALAILSCCNSMQMERMQLNKAREESCGFCCICILICEMALLYILLQRLTVVRINHRRNIKTLGWIKT